MSAFCKFILVYFICWWTRHGPFSLHFILTIRISIEAELGMSRVRVSVPVMDVWKSSVSVSDPGKQFSHSKKYQTNRTTGFVNGV